ncbi:unnamed protein product [Microthlaspi erraticum]|uniref:Uncharacterized protein n=1 Tax=Microthlaspi erraticum TaxID=1685480 RepID=A0A6D2KE30_9BRAS|nr:unnamed protein product [Microthlaspi erraticum]
MAAGDDTTPTETPTVTVAQLEALTAQMKQNEERLAQIQAENATLRAENASLVQARNRYRAPVPPMQSFDTPPLTGATGAALGTGATDARKQAIGGYGALARATSRSSSSNHQKCS